MSIHNISIEEEDSYENNPTLFSDILDNEAVKNFKNMWKCSGLYQILHVSDDGMSKRVGTQVCTAVSRTVILL